MGSRFADDPHRLAVAHHELGHYVVWNTLPGVRIREVRITGRGSGVEGWVRVDWPDDDTEVIDRGYLVGLLAGREADRVHHRTPGTPAYREAGCVHDMRAFRRARRLHAPSRALPEHRLRAEAERLVRARWDQITHLAPDLAARGRLRL
ncbi:hypothetical protein [Actinokineospora inagensis]|uniref:hypothetical protein n=1 Tax=Actinokineospora inagensis TaxID=103730 RepID=UPI00047BD671|nr:hypothetical protein [Actinokineospora inagensis]